MTMRIIKFRGIATANDKYNKIKAGDFVYGCFVETNIDCQILFGDGEQISVDRKTVGQFTGMIGDNDAMIWEHDIFVDDEADCELGTCSYGCVKYDESQAKFIVIDWRGENQGDLDEWQIAPIIGNKHQNPLLMKS